MTFLRRLAFILFFAIAALGASIYARAADPSRGGAEVFQSFFQTGAATSLSTSTSPARVTLTTKSLVVMVCNLGTAAVYVALGDYTISATTASLPVQPTTCPVLYSSGATTAGAVAVSSTPTLVFVPGTGHP